ncbi:hypothetical protein [Fischerella sp. JS2]|nr:hypothetical protein [Fischerella sp. JS2]
MSNHFAHGYALYQARLIAYDIMLSCWSLFFPITHHQLPITDPKG